MKLQIISKPSHHFFEIKFRVTSLHWALALFELQPPLAEQSYPGAEISLSTGDGQKIRVQHLNIYLLYTNFLLGRPAALGTKLAARSLRPPAASFSLGLRLFCLPEFGALSLSEVVASYCRNPEIRSFLHSEAEMDAKLISREL